MQVYIYDAVRTVRGKARADGGLAAFKPQELIGSLVDALQERGGQPRSSEALLLGCVGQFGDQGANIALVSKLHAKIADTAHAFTINNYCVSGLTAIGQAAMLVNSGGARLALAGGVEMMSRVPFMGDNAGYYQDTSFPNRTRYIPVVVAADRLAGAIDVQRADLDAVALASHQRAAESERIPARVASRIALGSLHVDECVRPTTSDASLSSMTAAFGPLAEQYADALDGPVEARHTVAHAPPICDGAGLAIMGPAPRTGESARARIVAYAESGGDPYSSLLAGFDAMHKVLDAAGLSLADMDRIEFMESFGVTIAKFMRDYPVDRTRVNASGGHLAKGHPMGASGAILVSSLLDLLDDADGRLGLVVCTAASGVGAAMIVERQR